MKKAISLITALAFILTFSLTACSRTAQLDVQQNGATPLVESDNMLSDEPDEAIGELGNANTVEPTGTYTY